MCNNTEIKKVKRFNMTARPCIVLRHSWFEIRDVSIAERNVYLYVFGLFVHTKEAHVLYTLPRP